MGSLRKANGPLKVPRLRLKEELLKVHISIVLEGVCEAVNGLARLPHGLRFALHLLL